MHINFYVFQSHMNGQKWIAIFSLTLCMAVIFMSREIHADKPSFLPKTQRTGDNATLPFETDAGVSEQFTNVSLQNVPRETSVVLESTSDPTLPRLKADLTLLDQGKPPNSSDLESLFSIPLDDPNLLKSRIKALPSEIVQMEHRITQLNEQLENPEALVPPITPPDVLASKPVPPVAPTMPTPPEKPSRVAIRAFLKKGKATTASDPRVVYKQAIAQYEQDDERYRMALKEYETHRLAYEEAVAVYQQAEAVYRTAVADRAKEISVQEAVLRTELTNIENRVAIAKLRLAYLQSFAGILDRFTAPGLEMFQSLKSPRTALRKRAETIEQLSKSAAALLKRVRILSLHADAGSLLGFQVQRNELAHNLAEEVLSFEHRIKKAQQLAVELKSLAEEIETDSREQRTYIMVNAKSKNVASLMDQTFQSRLKESRRASRLSSGFAVTDRDLLEVQTSLDALILKPKSISTVSDGEKALLEVRSAGEQIDKLLDAIPMGLDRFRQAYKREIVTIYSSLASDEVRYKVYSFSYAFLEDFVADMSLLKVDLSLWAEARLNGISKISDSIRTLEGQIRIARVVSGLILILFLMVMRRPIRRRSARLILRLINLKAFKKRAGLVVRLTVFFLALIPIALAAGAGYALLYLIGIEYSETKIAEIAFRWGVIYVVGRQIVIGLTRRERSGRPPLLEISKENFVLLRVTYARLGFFLVIIAAADEWSREWMGTGSLNTMVRFVASGWLGIWVLWAMFAWRRSMARACLTQFKHSIALRRVASFTETHLIGVFLTPLLFLLLTLWALIRASRRLLAEGNLLAYLRARSLRRLSRKTQVAESIVPSLDLPSQYIAQFPLYPLHGEEGEVLLPRKPQMDLVLQQLAHWRNTKQNGSLVLIGEKGIGKTTFLALIERKISDIRITRHVFARKLRTEQELLEEMCRPLGLHEKDLDGLARHFNEDEPQVVLLDEAHNIFLRTVDGFRAVDALVSLVDATSEKVFWVLVFNSYSWSFLNKANRHVRAFRKVLRLPPWSQNELKELVARRNERAGLTVQFDEILLDAETSSTGGFELIDSADGFFRLLWEASRGNPRVATYLWLNALTTVSTKQIRVGLIREEDSDFLARLDATMLFFLASMTQHENLSFKELSMALNVSVDEAVQTGRFLLEYGLLEPKHTDANRFTLAPRFHQQVLRTLRSRHLLYLEE